MIVFATASWKTDKL